MVGREATLLLNPGPVSLSERVRGALLEADLCHREPEYLSLQAEVGKRLEACYQTAGGAYAAVLLTGSGTSAVEAMIGSLVPGRADKRPGKALVLVNGVYGRRMASILERQGKDFVTVESEFDAPFDVAAAREIMARERTLTHVLAVHHETTTGRLNPVAALGEACREHGLPLLLDTVSSFGAEEIGFAAWSVQAVAATANKCLHGVPGIAFVLVRRDVLEKGSSHAPSLYLDLFTYGRVADGAYPPFTPSVQVMYALREGLRELEEQGGWEGRRARYRTLSARVRQGLADLGIVPFLSDPQSGSCVLTSYALPPDLPYQALHDDLKEAGFVIYAGQGPYHGRMFRVSTMGALADADMERFLEAVARTRHLRAGDGP